MRILVLHWGNNGGGPKFTFEMASGLMQVDGVEVMASYSSCADNADEWAALNLPKISITTYRTPLEFGTGIVRWLRAVIALRKFIKQHDVDVVYSGMLSLWQSLALPFTIPRNVFYVASIHDATEHPGDEGFLKRIARAKEIRRADLVAVYSKHAQSGLESQVRRGLRVAPLRIGISSHASERRTIDSNKKVVLGFFGRVVEYKGIGLFARAVQTLVERGLSVRGVVFGNGEVSEELIAQTAESIEWNIRWIESEEIPSIFRNMDVLVLPYLEASQSAVLTQAVGFGVPVVATPIGGLTEQVTSSGAGVVANGVSPDELADAIQSLILDPAAYQKYSANGLESARTHLSWKSVASDLVAAVEDVRRGRQCESLVIDP